MEVGPGRPPARVVQQREQGAGDVDGGIKQQEEHGDDRGHSVQTAHAHQACSEQHCEVEGHVLVLAPAYRQNFVTSDRVKHLARTGDALQGRT